MTNPADRVASPRASQQYLPVAVASVALFVFVFFLRFNTLGGALGGFDNDHFLHFVYAKQVQAGEQPLRDFMDAGLQGAVPSLTYELSAAAQTYLGNNLRSEACLTVAGVALGATMAFIAASRLALWPWALVTALLSALVAPKLYGYPKVLSLAVASLLIVLYAVAPSWRRVGLMAVWTAIAFLFRHDYAVYCAVGSVAVIVLTQRTQWRTTLRHAMGYGVVTVLLLAPSLWWIQHYRGLTEYVRNALEMSRREAERTAIDWPRPNLSGVHALGDLFDREENTEAWLYYLFLSVPAAAAVVAGRRWFLAGETDDSRPAAVLAVSLMSVVVAHYFLRGNLEARFGDVASLIAVPGAYLLSVATSRGSSRARWVIRSSVATAVLLVTVMSIVTLERVGSEVGTARLLEPKLVIARMRLVAHDLALMPSSIREQEAGDRMKAAAYLHRCTRPTDRVLIIGYSTETLAFAERLFAGGRATFVSGFYMNERYSRETIAKLDRESVPIAFAITEPEYARIPLLLDYMRSHYSEVGQIEVNGGSMRVLARHGTVGAPSGPGGLPCLE